MVLVRSRAAALATSLAIAASLLVAAAIPASAQSCPTSGGGTTCFGGMKYCPSNGQCYDPPGTCTGGQVMDCNACGCVCPSGKTLCSTSGVCVNNRACPSGTSWDPCTDTCGTPYVLLSPTATQNGFVKVSGDLTLTAGDLRLEQATGAGQGEIYLSNGKTVHVDGSGTTGLTFANALGTGLRLNLPASTQLCFGSTCRNSWPSSTDFDPTYLNVGGDTMGGLLILNGGVRMASGAASGKVLMSDASGNGSWQILPQSVAGTGTANYLSKFTAGATIGNSQLYDNGTSVGVGTASPASKLDVAGTARMTGLQLTTGASAGRMLVSDASGNGSWQSVSYVGGTGSANYVPKFSGASTLANSVLYDGGSGIGIGTTAPGAYKLNVSSSGDAAYFGSGNSWFKMWTGGNSRLSLGDGNGREAGFIAGGQNSASQNTLTIAGCQDGGSCPQYMTVHQNGNVGIGNDAPSYDLDISGSARVTGSIVLGGTSRSSWPSLSTTTTYCQYNAGSGAAWKACYCPGGYAVTGWYGYNCESNGGEWECSASAPYGSSAVQVWHDSAATAYVWAQCARVN